MPELQVNTDGSSIMNKAALRADTAKQTEWKKQQRAIKKAEEKRDKMKRKQPPPLTTTAPLRPRSSNDAQVTLHSNLSVGSSPPTPIPSHPCLPPRANGEGLPN